MFHIFQLLLLFQVSKIIPNLGAKGSGVIPHCSVYYLEINIYYSSCTEFVHLYLLCVFLLIYEQNLLAYISLRLLLATGQTPVPKPVTNITTLG